MTISLDGRVAVVTGAARGIGRCIAETFSNAGASVVCVDLEAPDDGPGVAVSADLTTRKGNAAAVDAALDRFGRLDVVVANAGFQHVAPVADFPEDRWDALLALMLTSPFLLAKYAQENNIGCAGEGSRRRALRGGRVGSRAGGLPLQGRLRLCEARRAGADQDARARRCTRGHHRHGLCPGYVRAALVEAQIDSQAQAHGLAPEQVLDDVILAPHAMKRMLEPEEVAEAALFLMGPAGRSMTGVPLTMDYGWTAR